MGRSRKLTLTDWTAANNALMQYFEGNKSKLAKHTKMSRTTVTNFFNQKPIGEQLFRRICFALRLNWQEIMSDTSESVDLNSREVENKKVREDVENPSKIERSIEFPSEYWEAGTSILSYFNRILNVKYPNEKIKVKIEQEGLTLRMIIDPPNGQKEEIEKTLDEYGKVVNGKLRPEDLFDDPFEAMALQNKLEVAALELRQTEKLLSITRDNSQRRIESLEIQVDKLHFIIEKGLKSGDHVIEVIKKMSEQENSTYNLSGSKFGGGFATEGALQLGGNFVELSSAGSLTDASQHIQDVLQQFQGQGVTEKEAKQYAASELAKHAKNNPTLMGKLVMWGQSLADTASKTTVSEATKSVVKLALQISGIPLP
ncbi:MAG: hypothetical protein AAGD25_28885 [Cyanobacteria bacterium P01_F01_bin.150]